jgi:hypothetical protein
LITTVLCKKRVFEALISIRKPKFGQISLGTEAERFAS